MFSVQTKRTFIGSALPARGHCACDHLWLSYGHDDGSGGRAQGSLERVPPAGPPRPRAHRPGPRDADRPDRPVRSTGHGTPDPPPATGLSRPPRRAVSASPPGQDRRRRLAVRRTAWRAMTAYLDSSVVLRNVLREPGALREWRAVRRGVASALVEVECLRTLDRLRLRHGLAGPDVAALRQAIFRLLEEAE